MLYTSAAGTEPELTAKQVVMLFPTPMFTGKLADLTLCDRLEKTIRELRESGKGQSSPKGASPAYMTPDDLHTHPEMKELVGVIMRESERYWTPMR